MAEDGGRKLHVVLACPHTLLVVERSLAQKLHATGGPRGPGAAMDDGQENNRTPRSVAIEDRESPPYLPVWNYIFRATSFFIGIGMLAYLYMAMSFADSRADVSGCITIYFIIAILLMSIGISNGIYSACVRWIKPSG